jgi:hypothetical protein
LGDKFTEMNNWKDERFFEFTSQLYYYLAMKEEALKEIQEVV